MKKILTKMFIKNMCKILTGVYNDTTPTSEDIWHIYYDHLSIYLKENGTTPPSSEKLGLWTELQKVNYEKKIHMMSIGNHCRRKWEALYRKYPYLANSDVWDMNYKKLICYLGRNGVPPSIHSNDPETIHLAQWTANQKRDYAEKKNAMKDDMRRMKWEMLYRHHVAVRIKDIWETNYSRLIEYIKTHGHAPQISSNDPYVWRLAAWVNVQKERYKTPLEYIKADISLSGRELSNIVKWRRLVWKYECLQM